MLVQICFKKLIQLLIIILIAVNTKKHLVFLRQCSNSQEPLVKFKIRKSGAANFILSCKCPWKDLASERNLQVHARRLFKKDLASVTCGILQVLDRNLAGKGQDELTRACKTNV
jgi:hypothetical protein